METFVAVYIKRLCRDKADIQSLRNQYVIVSVLHEPRSGVLHL